MKSKQLFALEKIEKKHRDRYRERTGDTREELLPTASELS